MRFPNKAGDHSEPHALTVRTGKEAWGCSNRAFAAGYWAPDRTYRPDGSFVMGSKFIPHTMSTKCRQSGTLNDVRCNACRERGLGDAYVESVRSQGK